MFEFLNTFQTMNGEPAPPKADGWWTPLLGDVGATAMQKLEKN